MKYLLLFICCVGFFSSCTTTSRPGSENWHAVRSIDQAYNDVKNGNAVIYMSGPHSGYEVPTPVGVSEDKWQLIKNIPTVFLGETLPSGLYMKAISYNEVVINAL